MKSTSIRTISSLIFLLHSIAPLAQAATITVDSTADSGPGTLRAALAGAASGDTINFALALPATITLASGELMISNSLVIAGPGATNLTVDADWTSRVFYIAPGASVRISGLTMINGISTASPMPTDCGGAIYNDDADLAVTDCVLSGNSAGVLGGAIFSVGILNGSHLQVSNCVVSGNVAYGDGGGIYNDGSYVDAVLVLEASTISGNRVLRYHAGGGICNAAHLGNASAAIHTSTFSDNNEGAIWNQGSGGHAETTIDDSTISQNPDGGIVNIGREGRATLTMTNVTVSNNSGPGISNVDGDSTVSHSLVSGNKGTYGGGIYNFNFGLRPSGTSLNIVDSIVRSNSASQLGGGIFNDDQSTNSVASMRVAGCILSHNGAVNGGALFNRSDTAGGEASAEILQSTIRDNWATNGAGIWNDGGQGYPSGFATVTLKDSTLSGNQAGLDAGAVFNWGTYGVASVEILHCTLSSNSAVGGRGGGLFNNSFISSGTAKASVLNSTFNGNSAPYGGGIVNGGGTAASPASFGTGTLSLGGTILNAGISGANITSVALLGPVDTFTSLGHNLSSDDSGAFLSNPTDQVGTDPMLGPLQDNGGPTLTHALLCGSPAIDRGTNFTDSATDQRGVGFTRIFDDPAVANATGGDGADIGAFEVQLGACAPPDTDGDGVPDAIDQCPDTPPGAITDAAGCSIHQLVRCEGPREGGTWKSHGQYVRAMIHVATDFLKARLITRRQWAQIVTSAARSRCGWNRHWDHDGDRDWRREWAWEHDRDWGRD
jgi:fibronectin-binding autotransporter adhesin